MYRGKVKRTNYFIFGRRGKGKIHSLVAFEETVRRVVIPKVTRPGTALTSIQKATHEITTMSIVGR